MRLFYSPTYVRSAYAFDTTRKAQWIADSLAANPIEGIALAEPTPLRRGQVLEAHDPAYVQAVETGSPRSLAESQGFHWDPGLWPMVLSSNGGAVAAALAALEDGVSGSLSSGLHHARRGRGAGFCTFNGLVLAARAALEAGAGAVLVLDLDAHCGGGAASLIDGDNRIRQIDVSVCAFDAYASTANSQGLVVQSASDYLPTIRQVLEQADRAAPFGLCLYNAGMDPYQDCPIGGLPGITAPILAEREALVFGWCQARRLPIAFVQAGGYVGQRLDVDRLVSLHRLTLSAARSTASRA